MQVGKIYKVKVSENYHYLGKLQAVSRGITVGTLDGKVRHFVEMSFRTIGDEDSFGIKVPLDERLEPDDPRVEEITNAILGGTQVPKGVPRAPTAPSETP